MWRRRRNKTLLARLARFIALVQLAMRGARVARRVHRLRRTIIVGAIGVVVAFVLRRRRTIGTPEPTLTYAPPPTPTVTPDGPPLDAAENS